MIGNDVIDLKLAQQESNWQRKGYLDKLFSASEQALIFKAKNQTEMVWILWSIKESVYKAYLRMDYNRGFYPSKIEVTSLEKIIDCYQANVQLYHLCFCSLSKVNENRIHSIAVHNELDISKVKFLKRNISYKKDNNGLPLDKFHNPISVSHHGIYKNIISYSEVIG